MAETDLDRGPVSRGGIAPRPLFAVGAVLLGAFLANFDSRLTSVGLPDLRGASRSHFVATTVDLLTTGVDVPVVRNIVFFKFRVLPNQ